MTCAHGVGTPLHLIQPLLQSYGRLLQRSDIFTINVVVDIDLYLDVPRSVLHLNCTVPFKLYGCGHNAYQTWVRLQAALASDPT